MTPYTDSTTSSLPLRDDSRGSSLGRRLSWQLTVVVDGGEPKEGT